MKRGPFQISASVEVYGRNYQGLRNNPVKVKYITGTSIYFYFLATPRFRIYRYLLKKTIHTMAVKMQF